MTKQQFETFLEARACDVKPQNRADWEARKSEWLSSLQAFYAELEAWLSDYLKTGKIEMERSEVELEEEHLGKYRAEMRVLRIGTDLVVLRPVGTFLLGTRGRVDMEGPKGAVRFILTSKHSDGDQNSLTFTPPGEQAPASSLKNQPEPPDEWVWKIATPPPKVRFIELTADLFFDALTEVLNE